MKLVVSCTSGLCNRIHAILGAKMLADRFGRELQIFWANNLELNADYDRVFTTPLPLFTNEDLIWSVSRPEVTIRIFNSGLQPFYESDFVADSEHDVIFIKPWFMANFMGERFDRDKFWAAHGLLQTMLKFRPDVVNRAEPKSFGSHVGVHIRYGDLQKDGTTKHADYFKHSNFGTFRSAMAKIAEHTPGVKFYVATQVAEFKHELARSFNVDFIDANPYRSDKGISDSIVDLLNLSGCAVTLGTRLSQFSRMVNQRTAKPVLLLSDEGHVINHESVDTPLPDNNIVKFVHERLAA